MVGRGSVYGMDFSANMHANTAHTQICTNTAYAHANMHEYCICTQIRHTRKYERILHMHTHRCEYVHT